jgi:phytoene dehydrogenase-like protein
MTEKSIIIIGAGIAGLSAGCYGQMNGYRTRIFELHDKPGGLCTSWKRKGYTFDGCIYWLAGSKAGTPTNRIWQELGAVQGRRFIEHDVYHHFEGNDGRALSIYTNLDRLERHMKELSPADADVIEEFCNSVRRFAPFAEVMSDPSGPSGLLDGIKMVVRMLPLVGKLLKYTKTSKSEFSERFSDPLLRQAFTTTIDALDVPIMVLIGILALMNNRDGGCPIGGSLEFSRAIERRYLDLGGQIHYRSRVERILVEPDPAGRADRAVGVRLVDGTEHRADVVISAADGRTTIFDMLEGRYVSDKVRSYYENLPVWPSWVQVSLGIARDLSDQEAKVCYQLDEPIHIAGEKVEYISYRHFCQDPSMAPAGKSAVTTILMSDHSYWKELYKEPERYEAEKKDIAAKVIDQLERRLPGIAERIEVVDVSTPMTVERYTGNWQGAMEGWMITTDNMLQMIMSKGMDKTLPGLDGFFMIGQWVQPGGGVPPMALLGRDVIGMICKRDKRPFVTTVP